MDRESRLDVLLSSCHVVWFASIIYASYCTILESRRLHYHVDPGQFLQRSPEFVLSRIGFPHQDVSDDEWAAFKRLLQDHYIWLLLFILMSLVNHGLRTRSQQFAFSIYTMVFTVYVMNVISLVILLIVASSTILVTYLLKSCLKRNTSRQPNQMLYVIVSLIPYITFFSTLVLLHSHLGEVFKKITFSKNDLGHFLFDVCITWFSAKCLSYSVDCLRDSGMTGLTWESMTTALCYLFYFPSFVTGPVHLFHDFKKDLMDIKKRENTIKGSIIRNRIQAVTNLMMKITKLVFYTLFLEILLHLIHTQALSTLFFPSSSSGVISVGKGMTGWTFCGLGYTLTCLFYLKYYILYGAAQSLSRFNDINLPDPPQCVSRTCQSTILWRTFDRGLYSWLVQYFYRPIVSFAGDDRTLWSNKQYCDKISFPEKMFLKIKQIAASFLCFACVCLWHRGIDHIIVWCCINLASVVIERFLNDSDFMKRHMAMKSVVSAPLFAIMIISNIFFLSNYHLGEEFIRRIFLSPSFSLFVPLMFIMFAGCYVSFDLEKRFGRRQTDGRVMFHDNTNEDEQHLL